MGHGNMPYNSKVMWHLSLALLAALAQNPRQPETLHPGAISGKSALATANDHSASVWVDAATQEVQVSYADGRGAEWSTPTRIDDDLSGAVKVVTSRCLAAADDALYAVWMDHRNGAADAYLSKSADRGMTWSTPQRLDDGYAAGAQAVTDLQVVADNSYVFIAMRVAGPMGGEDIMMASSMDFGATWNATLKANAMMADCDAMAICCEDLNVFITWADERHAAGLNDAFLRMSHDGGANWMMSMMDEQIDASGPGVGNVEGDRMLIEGGMGGLVVGWCESQTATTGVDHELRARYSPDGGHMWPFAEALVTTAGHVQSPSLDMDQATILLTWQDDRSGSQEVHASVSKDFSLSWTEHGLSNGSGGTQPSVNGYNELWAVSWLSAGATPQAQMSISRDTASAFLPSIALQMTGADATGLNLAFNARYQNFVASWTEAAATTASLHAGGARPQSLQAVSPGFAVGDPIHFEASHFPIADSGTPFAVLLSSGIGGYRLPFGDGRNTGLLDNPYQPTYLPLLSGVLDASGSGTTATLTIPNTPGATWYAAGLAYLSSASGTYLLRLTDVIAVEVQ
jgi:hypothetical protein